MLLIIFLPCYFVLISTVPPFFTRATIKKGFYNMKLYKQITSPSKIGKTVKKLKYNTRN